MENFYKLNASQHMYILTMMWTAEIQISKWRYDCRSGNCNFLNFFGGFNLQLVKLEFPLWRSYVHFYVHCTFCSSILGMKTFLLDGWHKPKLNSQNNADVKLMHVWRVIEGQQSMYTKQWPVLLLFYRTPANVSNYFSKRPWYSLSQEC